MNVVAIIQARMGSTRLPGKVLADLAGKPMLSRVVERTSRATRLDSVVVATTQQPEDHAIVGLCRRQGWPCYRGATEDVLDRFYKAAHIHHADVIVRITADEPLMDPALIDDTVEQFLKRAGEVDYVANFLPPRTYPRGLEVEAFSFHALERSWREDTNPAWREHVDLYIHRRKELFHVIRTPLPEDLSWMRWTVDTADDLALIRRIYAFFGHDRFTWREVLREFLARGDWQAINHDMPHRKAG